MGAERLGRYRLLTHLASGGMADVLVARTEGIEGFERHVVVKRIKAEHAKDQRFIQMFLDEARVAAGLHHQNIVQVHDIGESNGEYYFAMEYIHGEDLRKILSTISKSKAHMPLGYVATIVSAVAAGLHHAHDRRGPDKKPQGIVHRDVSPSNILVSFDGGVKVVDFGIAKAAMRQVETQSGSLKGKVSYMSPEQCKGDPVDRRSDVYSLGVVLYEMATTTRLFKGDNDYRLMDAIVNGRVPLPRVRRPDLPAELAAIIMKALATDPARRYQTADELRVALDQFVIKAGLAASMSALASYMHKLFGEKLEPWLDPANATSVDAAPPDVDADTAMARASWTEVPRDDVLAAEQEAGDDADDAGDGADEGTRANGPQDAKTRTDRKLRNRRRGGLAAAAPSADSVSPPSQTRSMAWESQGHVAGAPRNRLALKLALVTVPLVVITAVLVWQRVHQDRRTAQVASAGPAIPVSAPTMGPVGVPSRPVDVPSRPVDVPSRPVGGTASPTPVPSPGAAAPAPEVPAGQAPVVGAPAAPQPVEPARGHDATVPRVGKSIPARKVGPVAKAAEPVAAAVPASTPVAAPTPVPAPVVAPTPPPDPPKEVEAVLAQLSGATISAVASDHGRELVGCESGTELHGEVSVVFQIDGAGKVVKSQLSSSIKNPKVASCILKAVQGWKFPRPPTGAAKGVYSVSYQ